MNCCRKTINDVDMQFKKKKTLYFLTCSNSKSNYLLFNDMAKRVKYIELSDAKNIFKGNFKRPQMSF